MGKVIRLDASRQKANVPTGTRDSRPARGLAWMVSAGFARAIPLCVKPLSRVIALLAVEVAITLFALIVRPLRVLMTLMTLAVLFSVIFGFLDHWRHVSFLLASMSALALISALNACFKYGLAKAHRTSFKLRGS